MVDHLLRGAKKGYILAIVAVFTPLLLYLVQYLIGRDELSHKHVGAGNASLAVAAAG
ncbi:MAG: hypothetical protein LBO73_03070 [Holosporaceae bacterium]|nr:hypothetical protein [Holosporaceae bacterium]